MTVLGSNGARTPFLCLVCLTALGIGHALPNSGLGAENEGVDKPKGSVSERTTNSDKGDREKNDQSGGDDSVRHHAVLGVSLTKSAEGVTVVGVIPDSAAERAGLRMGDEIRHVGDQRIHTIQELTDEIRASKPGTQIDLLVRRDGQRLVVSAKLGTQASTSGTRDRRPQYSQSYSNMPVTHSVQPANLGRAPSSYNAATGQTGGREQQLNQQIRALQRQVYLLNQQVFQLRSSQNNSANEANDIEDWWERGQRGENGDDPALFQ
jgi:membrane-associated protease RseP (regulator of RpoE activity)